jgi:hypothetical protein
VSELYADAEAALNFEAPPGSPWDVLAVIYGERLETPDPIDTVEATWTPHDYPGTFISRDVKGVNWQAGGRRRRSFRRRLRAVAAR